MRQNLAEALRQDPDSLDMSTRIVNACAEAKGNNIAVFNASRVSDLFSYAIIASGRSDRQVQGISNRIIDEMEKQGVKPLSVEGLDQAHWVILDFGDVVVHVFFEPARAHYNLEGLLKRATPLKIKKQRNRDSLVLAAK